jgi:hypothetical protein
MESRVFTGSNDGNGMGMEQRLKADDTIFSGKPKELN